MLATQTLGTFVAKEGKLYFRTSLAGDEYRGSREESRKAALISQKRAGVTIKDRVIMTLLAVAGLSLCLALVVMPMVLFFAIPGVLLVSALRKV